MTTLGVFARANVLLLLCGGLIEAALTAVLFLGDLAPRVELLWVCLAPAFVCYGLACANILRGGRGSLRLILVLAAVFRLTLLWTTPSLSDDVNRYVWDGRVQVAGINPYVYAPDASALVHLRDDAYADINNRELRTIYPPLGQLFFAAVSWLRPGVVAMKVAFLICEAALLLVLLRLLRQRRSDARRVVLYAWNPLAVIEIAGSGHMDVVAILLAMLALYLAMRLRRHAAALALACGILAKLVPALLLPALWRAFGTARTTDSRALLSLFNPAARLPLLWVPLVVAGGYWLYAEAEARPFESLEVYAEKWRFNDAAFTVVYEHLRQPELAWDDDALVRAHDICNALLVAVVLWSLVRHVDPLRTAFVCMGAHVLLSATLHPWYLLWVLPFLPFFPNLAWLLFSALVFLAYQVLPGYSNAGVWEQEAWVKWAQYAPFYFLLIAAPLWDTFSPWRGTRAVVGGERGRTEISCGDRVSALHPGKHDAR